MEEELLSMGFSVEQVGAVKGIATNLEEAVELIMSAQMPPSPSLARDVANPLIANIPNPLIANIQQEETRMVIVVRTDLKMSTGKIAAQVAHAAVGLVCRMQKSREFFMALEAWERNNTPKICLQCQSLEELNQLEDLAIARGLATCAIRDAGRTQVGDLK